MDTTFVRLKLTKKEGNWSSKYRYMKNKNSYSAFQEKYNLFREKQVSLSLQCMFYQVIFFLNRSRLLNTPKADVCSTYLSNCCLISPEALTTSLTNACGENVKIFYIVILCWYKPCLITLTESS